MQPNCPCDVIAAAEVLERDCDVVASEVDKNDGVVWAGQDSLEE